MQVKHEAEVLVSLSTKASLQRMGQELLNVMDASLALRRPGNALWSCQRDRISETDGGHGRAWRSDMRDNKSRAAIRRKRRHPFCVGIDLNQYQDEHERDEDELSG